MTTGSPAKALVATPTSELMTANVTVLDWVDGSLEGFLSLENPASTWYFRIFADNVSSEDVDDRLFALTPISGTLMREILGLVDMDNSNMIVVPEGSAASLAHLDRVIGQLGSPEVMAIFDESMLIQRAWADSSGRGTG